MPSLLYATVPDEKTARDLARGLIKFGLAAGVNLAGPIYSFYRWQGELHEGQEWQLFAQISSCAFADVEKYILSNHPHETPCIIAMKIDQGYADFTKWIRQNSGVGSYAPGNHSLEQS